jgi:hypothetical protein
MNKRVRNIVTVALALPAILAGSAIAAADAYDPLTLPVGPTNNVSYIVEDGAVERNAYIGIMPGSVNSSGESRQWKWCTGLDDPICDPHNAPNGMKATSFLPPCATAQSEDCVDSLEVANGNQFVKAKLIRITAGLTFPASPEYNYLGSSNISLWDVPGVPSASGQTTYALMPRVQAYFQNGKFKIGEFYGGVTPYKEVTGPYKQIRIDTSIKDTPRAPYTYSRYAQTCVYEEDGVCGKAQDFSAGTRVRLKIRLSKEVGGWFHGRLKDPVLDVANFSSRNSVVTIDASPVTVPRMALVMSKTGLNDQEKIWYQNLGYWPTLDDGNGTGAQAGDPINAFPMIDYYRTKVNDTAVGSNTFWNFSTTSWGAGSQCFQDRSKLLGIVTTNAMAYDGDTPAFEDGALNYHVAGLHFMPDGVTPVQGTYSLVMRSEVARCLYSFTSAPIKATISVAGTGSSIVATTVSGESNGWLTLSAAGFTFSNKTIQVKLTQDAPVPASTPVATPTSSSAVAPKKTTITCIKGKLTKSVTAVKPTCPAGYKKK